MTTEGDIGRALNVVSATLNDQGDEHFDPERVDTLVSEWGLVARPDPGHPDTGWLDDEDGTRVAEVRYAGGRWEVERIAAARSETYPPSKPPARDRARMQAKQGRIALIGAAAAAVIVFVVLLVVLGVEVWVCVLAALGVLLVGGGAGMVAKQKLSE